jgi:uncharacterized repeat protein (TIGR03806 family)
MTTILLLTLFGSGEALPSLGMPATASGRIPQRLSETGAFADVRQLIPANELIPYEINLSFWSDGADKRRWIALPTGTSIDNSPAGEWRFPAGAVFVKHFHVGAKRVETRLLVRSVDGGVYGVSYRWRDDGSDADLVTSAHRAPLELDKRKRPWFFPGPDDCRKCHSAETGVLGVNARQLNRHGTMGDNQLVAWSRSGLLARFVTADEAAKLPRLTPPRDESSPLAERVRSYLDVNCGLCHRPGGAAADFDARFDTPLERRRLIDAPARIDLGIDGARQVAPNDPWRSLALVRMQMHGETGMPPLAHEAIDREGVELLRGWIASLPGPPTLAPPAITPKGGDFRTPVAVEIKHADRDAVIRYTLDGAPPTAASPIYREAIRLTKPKTLRARAFKRGFTNSVTATETFIVGD